MAQAFLGPERRAEQNWLRFRSLLPVGIVVAIAIAAAVAIYPILNGQGTGTPDMITTGFGIALAVLLSVMPAVVCTVQNVSLRRQRAELDTLKGMAVTGTSLYVTAQRTISDDTGDAWIDNDYIVPSFVYFVVCFFGFMAMFLGYGRPELFYRPTVFLGGMINAKDLATYATYQRETFCVAAMALAGAYAYALGRILDRINNNDLYPVSLYYYSVRLIIACIVATVLRHSIVVL